jgi:hypothetical protein
MKHIIIKTIYELPVKPEDLLVLDSEGDVKIYDSKNDALKDMDIGYKCIGLIDCI